MGGRYAVTMLSAVIVFVYVLAVARVTRLITEDKLTEGPRRRLSVWLWARTIRADEAAQRMRSDAVRLLGRTLDEARRFMAYERLDGGAEPPLSVYLVSCPWCASIYVAAVAAPVAYWWGSEPWFLVPALALAFSHLTGLLAKIGD